VVEKTSAPQQRENDLNAVGRGQHRKIAGTCRSNRSRARPRQIYRARQRIQSINHSTTKTNSPKSRASPNRVDTGTALWFTNLRSVPTTLIYALAWPSETKGRTEKPLALGDPPVENEQSPPRETDAPRYSLKRRLIHTCFGSMTLSG
jgi:hypothetical protein